MNILLILLTGFMFTTRSSTNGSLNWGPSPILMRASNTAECYGTTPSTGAAAPVTISSRTMNSRNSMAVSYHFVQTDYFNRQYSDEGFAVGEWELGGDGDGDGRKRVLKRHLQFRPHPLHCCSGLVRFMGGEEGGEGPTYCLMTHYFGAMRAYSFLEDEYEDVSFPDLPDQRSDYEWIDAKAFLFGEVLALV